MSRGLMCKCLRMLVMRKCVIVYECHVMVCKYVRECGWVVCKRVRIYVSVCECAIVYEWVKVFKCVRVHAWVEWMMVSESVRVHECR